MANLPGSIKNLNTLLGEQLAEGGGGGGGGAEPLIVRVDHSEGMVSYFDKTWQEVYDAAKAGSVVVAIDEYDAVFSFGIAQISPIDGHLVVFGCTDYKMDTVADSADGYLHTKAVG